MAPPVLHQPNVHSAMVRNRKPPLQPASPGKHGGSHCGGPLAQPARPCTLIGLMGLLNQECNVSGTALTKIEYLVYFMHLYRQDNGWAGALFTRAIRLRLNKKTSALLRSLALISRQMKTFVVPSNPRQPLQTLSLHKKTT